MKSFVLALVVALGFAATAEAQQPYCPNCAPAPVATNTFTVQPMQWARVPAGPPQTYQRIDYMQRTWSLLPWVERYRREAVIVPVQSPQQQPVIQHQHHYEKQPQSQWVPRETPNTFRSERVYYASSRSPNS